MNGQSGNHVRRFDFSHPLLEPFCTSIFTWVLHCNGRLRFLWTLIVGLAWLSCCPCLCRCKIERAIEILVFVYYSFLKATVLFPPLRIVTSVERILGMV
jgi:hypothetical protein